MIGIILLPLIVLALIAAIWGRESAQGCWNWAVICVCIVVITAISIAAPPVGLGMLGLGVFVAFSAWMAKRNREWEPRQQPRKGSKAFGKVKQKQAAKQTAQSTASAPAVPATSRMQGIAAPAATRTQGAAAPAATYLLDIPLDAQAQKELDDLADEARQNIIAFKAECAAKEAEEAKQIADAMRQIESAQIVPMPRFRDPWPGECTDDWVRYRDPALLAKHPEPIKCHLPVKYDGTFWAYCGLNDTPVVFRMRGFWGVFEHSDPPGGYQSQPLDPPALSVGQTVRVYPRAASSNQAHFEFDATLINEGLGPAYEIRERISNQKRILSPGDFARSWTDAAPQASAQSASSTTVAVPLVISSPSPSEASYMGLEWNPVHEVGVATTMEQVEQARHQVTGDCKPSDPPPAPQPQPAPTPPKKQIEFKQLEHGGHDFYITRDVTQVEAQSLGLRWSNTHNAAFTLDSQLARCLETPGASSTGG